MRHDKADRLTPRMNVFALARSKLLDALSGPQLVVLLRLVAATGNQASRRVRLINSELYRDARTAVRALRELEEMGLVKLRYEGGGWLDRTIEVR